MVDDITLSEFAEVLGKRKGDLRMRLKAMLASQEGAAIAAASSRVCDTVLKLLLDRIGDDYGAVLGWLNCFPGELDLGDLLDRVLPSKAVYLPSMLPAGQMQFSKIEKNWRASMQIEPNGFLTSITSDSPIWSPDSQAVVLIPGLAFDVRGGRLGRGKGYYDRFLAQYQSSIVAKVGICLDFQLVDEVPIGVTDILVDYICTEKGCSPVERS